MEARAVHRHIGIPVTKMRQVIDLIRGKPVEEALAILQFSPRLAARVAEKTLRSAIANATVRDEEEEADAPPAVDVEELFIHRVYADEGRTLKRLRPRARGAANRILKRQSHLTIVVSDGRQEMSAAASPPDGETEEVAPSEDE
ncbi:MAG: 50S ribosomal protein L22 [Gemmatimonadaceae bacterium]|nr:50S ribosomal protein L22 [Gemmatimonadaceae bacterium]